MTIEFTSIEDYNTLRTYDERDNSAITTQVITRRISPAMITQEEFEEFVKAYSTIEVTEGEPDKEWVFSHPDFDCVTYSYYAMTPDDDIDEFNSFIDEVARYFDDWGLEIIEV